MERATLTHQRLQRQLDKVAARVRRDRLLWSLAAIWLTAAASAFSAWIANMTLGLFVPRLPLLLALAAAAASLVATLVVANWSPDSLGTARWIESLYPDLKQRLLAAVEFRGEHRAAPLGFLEENVVQQVVTHAYAHPWTRVISAWRLAGAYISCGVVLLAFVAASTLLRHGRHSPLALVDTPAERASHSSSVSATVEPGDCEVERGSSVLVLARFSGELPREATIVAQDSSGEPLAVTMKRSLEDPMFGGRLAEVREPTQYRVDAGDWKSDSYTITVFDYPDLVRADATLVFPQYTSLDEQAITDVRHVTAVEGTRLILTCRLNKDVARAALATKNRDVTIPLARVDGKESVYRAEWVLQKSLRLQLHLVDDKERANKFPPEFSIRVVPNQPPDLKIAFPSRDVQASPLEEVETRASVWDDFGIQRFGMTVEQPGEEPREIVLGEKLAGKSRAEFTRLLALEELGVAPDELLAYHFWAEDLDAQGKARRSSSDIYFAEVRPFEEIFREGDAQPDSASQQGQGQGQGQGNQADGIAELQKQIVTATWKLIRREPEPGSSPPSDKFATDVETTRDSQVTAYERLQKLETQDAEMQRHVAAATEQMLVATKHLSTCHEDRSTESLRPALAAEQAAYQALLRLRAREHNVVKSRQQRGGGGGGGSSRSQMQLDQLELKNDANRYETERTASADQSQNREARQALNRLRELARRQGDLNEQLKELQTALEAARTDEEREEIQRQLKRLREEQEQILRDTDELRDRLETPANQERMADARQQLEQTRQSEQQAAEALEQGQVTRAAAAGTRAQRNLEQLRDQMREKASNQFREAMQQMRDSARTLQEREADVAQQLSRDSANEQANRQPGAGLREEEPREKLEQEIGQQRDRLRSLLNQMRDTVRDAEETQTMLAERLYDTVREADHRQLDRALEQMRQSVSSGLLDDASELEPVARSGIGALREGIEKAAESVLGDETEALRRARDELDRLSRDLNQEIAAATGDEVDDRQDARGGRRRGPPDAQQQREQEAPGDGKPDGRRQDDGQRETAEPGSRQENEANGERGEQDSDRWNRQRASQGRGGQARSNPAENQPNDTPRNSADQTGREADSRQQQVPNQAGGRDPSGRQERGTEPRNEPANQGGDGSRDGSQTPREGGSLREGVERLGTASDVGPVRSPAAPLTGGEFMEWSDRLRDVEEMVSDPELRAEAGRIRDRARDVRLELKRHSKEPNWDLVRLRIAEPLVELRRRVSDELLRRTARDRVAPLDRDPVPPKYEDAVRRYYELLGIGREAQAGRDAQEE